MSALDVLRNDQEALRRVLLQLESLAASSQRFGTMLMMREALSQILQAHLEREVEMFGAGDERVEYALRLCVLHNQTDSHVVLRDFEALFLGGGFVPTAALVMHLWRVLEEFREPVVEEGPTICTTMNATSHAMSTESDGVLA